MSDKTMPDGTEAVMAWMNRDVGTTIETLSPDELESLAFPLTCGGTVQSEWVDLNDHMNSLFYIIAIREASYPIFSAAGINRDYIGTSSVFLRETHVRYFRELRSGAPYLVRTWIAAIDERDVHSVAEMVHAEDNWRAASMEWSHGHVDFIARRSSPWPDDIRVRFQTMIDRSAPTLPHDLVGRTIKMRR
jgi:acyl-CoA thioester hydrolase